MDSKECERIAMEINNQYDDVQKKFILFMLLGEYKKECLSYTDNESNNKDAREVAKLTAGKASDIECLLAFDLW